MASVIEISRLRYSWSRGLPDVVDIEGLRVEAGERLFLRGPSGSGKSTLLSLLAGVALPQAGTLKVLGEEIGRMRGAARDRFRADHVGFIFQMFNLIPYLSVLENVCLPCGFSAVRKKRAIEAAGNVEAEATRLLGHLDMAHPDILHRPAAALSVGQQQRVAAARALIGAPEIVIADEPTSSLDEDRRAAFIDLLFRVCDERRSTLLFVSHDATLGSRFDRVVAFDEINRARPVAGALAAA
ncbi:MAG TPA: ABC transporter ATP-binding protein [Burkholderiales bacterium]|nr:ABC transporter ATP-binding protein [Burkholderiales bacterium]